MRDLYTTSENRGTRVSRISWGAIFAGALTALALVALLNLLGLGIGFSTIDPLTEDHALKGVGVGALIWFGLSNLAALFVGGLVAGRLSGFPARSDGGLHGFLAWALFAMVSLYLMTSAIGSVVSGLSSAISGLFGGGQKDNVTVMLSGAEEKAKGNTSLSYENIKKEAFQLINKAEKYNILPDDASEKARGVLNDTKKDAKQALNDLNLDKNIDEFFSDLSFNLDDQGNLHITGGGNAGELLDKQGLKDYLVRNTELDEGEIDGLITKWNKKIEQAVNKAETLYAEAKQKAIEYSDKAAEALAKACIGAFVIFLLGALAAFAGGATGSPLLSVADERRDRKEEELS